MSSKDKKAKREKAFNKLQNQISVLSRTVVKKDEKIIRQLSELASKLSLA